MEAEADVDDDDANDGDADKNDKGNADADDAENRAAKESTPSNAAILSTLCSDADDGRVAFACVRCNSNSGFQSNRSKECRVSDAADVSSVDDDDADI